MNSQHFTAHDAVSHLIGADGNPNLAAARASKELGVHITPAQLLATLSQDASAVSSLAQQVRTLAILRSIETFDLVHNEFRSRLDKLPAKDLATTYTKLLETMAQFGSSVPAGPATTPIDVLLRALPPQVADSVEFFIKNPPSEQAPAPASATTTQLDSAAITPSTEATP